MATERNDTTEQIPGPTDPSVDELAGIDGSTDTADDTEAHSMLSAELARTINSERVRDAERAARDRARAREARPTHEGGLLGRLRRR